MYPLYKGLRHRMNTLKLTQEHFDSDGWYIGEVDVSSQPFDGHIEIAENLGLCRFKDSVRARGSIRALAGTGTTLAEALKQGKHAIGIEINPEYLPMIHRKIEKTQLPLRGIA